MTDLTLTIYDTINVVTMDRTQEITSAFQKAADDLSPIAYDGWAPFVDIDVLKQGPVFHVLPTPQGTDDLHIEMTQQGVNLTPPELYRLAVQTFVKFDSDAFIVPSTTPIFIDHNDH